MSNNNLCLEGKEKSGKRVVFHEKHRKTKALKHPELSDLRPNGFVMKKIPDALSNPDRIYEDLTDACKRNYYKIEGYTNSAYGRTYFYTKVVVMCKWNPWCIITAYETQNIKEEADLKKCLFQKA
jgi:hypothetical protein